MADKFKTTDRHGDSQTWHRSKCGKYIEAPENMQFEECRVKKTSKGDFKYQSRTWSDEPWGKWHPIELDQDPEIPAAWAALMVEPAIAINLPIEGRKDDADKNRIDLLPFDALEEVAEIMTLGARKYADRNWESGINYNRLFRAALGHLWAWWMRRDDGKGPGNDKETGRTHLAHAACCVLFLLTFELRKMTKFDNRPTM
jgi:hypothetical protein